MADIPAFASPAPSTPATTGLAVANSSESAWQVRFGFWDDVDVLYNALPPPKKPRVPSAQLDSASEWAKRMVPTSSDGFLGNPSALQCLANMQNGDPNPLSNFVISGGECTGKMAFIGLLKRALLASGLSPPCAFGSVNAKHFDEKSLLLKIEDFVRRVDPRKAGAAFLVVERLEAVSPSTQQHVLLPAVLTANAKNVFFVLQVRPDATKVADQIKQRALRVHLHPLKPTLVRAKLLHICKQERIGFTRDGLEALLTRSDFKLLPSMEALREVFQHHFFVSLPNAQKPTTRTSKTTTTAAAPPFPLSVLEMSAPLRRCTKCTLLPPCSHVTTATLLDRIERVRHVYPHQSDGAAAVTPPISLCPSFLKTGVCSNVQALGRCRYAHPLDLHVVDTSQIVRRCGTHTLPVPCSHCANVRALQERLRGESTAGVALETQLHARRAQLAELELSRFQLARERSKSAKWGAAKRELDDQLASLEATLAATRCE
ncbi:hypothetical protein PybrP1_006068, partial [[Pythium] brassicae (nom. inval.)]